MKLGFPLVLLALLFSACGNSSKTETNAAEPAAVTTERIVSLNGALTEILAALHYEDQIVGVDVTSTFPASIQEQATNLGHVNKISVESIMQLKPTLVLGLEHEVSDAIQNQLQEAGIPLQLIALEPSIDGTKKAIQEVASRLQAPSSDALVSTIDADLKSISTLKPSPKVLFLYARGGGMLLVAGTDTPIDEMIQLAGGHNAITSFSDYKPLTPEFLLESNPDYILLFDKGLESLGGVEGVLKIEGVAQTTAGQNKQIIAMDGQLLSGFGPRVGKAVQELHTLLSKS